MIREENTGQSSEIYDSYNDEQATLYIYSGTTGNKAYQPANNSSQHIYHIDEGSLSLAVQPTMTEETAQLLCGSARIKYIALYAPLFDFYSLGKLQI